MPAETVFFTQFDSDWGGRSLSSKLPLTVTRCLVPLTSFSENEKDENGKAVPVWFALSEERPLVFFAGIWTSWRSVRKVKEREVVADLYGLLTTEPNPEVGAVHPKAMPVTRAVVEP